MLNITFSEARNPDKYDLFSQFLRDAHLDYRWLELAEGFTDNLLGLIHFAHFLREEQKLSGPILEQAKIVLKTYLTKHNAEIRCKVRFFELFEAKK